jgi:hypothetical protein
VRDSIVSLPTSSVLCCVCVCVHVCVMSALEVCSSVHLATCYNCQYASTEVALPVDESNEADTVELSALGLALCSRTCR